MINVSPLPDQTRAPSMEGFAESVVFQTDQFGASLEGFNQGLLVQTSNQIGVSLEGFNQGLLVQTNHQIAPSIEGFAFCIVFQS